MHSIDVLAALDTLEDALDTLVEGSFDAPTHPELLAVLERLERHRRRLPVVEHRVIARLAAEASPLALGGTNLASVLAIRLRLSGAEARRRVEEAADLGLRRTLGGEELAPRLAATAQAQARGEVSGEHVRLIRR